MQSLPAVSAPAGELETGFNAAVEAAEPSGFIASYADALPWCDRPSSAVERQQEYRERLKELSQSSCDRHGGVRRCK